MKNVNPHVKAFTKLFSETARYHHRFEVFRDFVTMSGIAIQNALVKSDDLEQEYLQIVGRYKKDDAVKMSHLLSETVMGLELYPCDFLGRVFMELELGSGGMGQFFTPYEVSRMMAEIQYGDSVSLISEEKPFITLQEPACGAAGMVIAFAEVMRERGYNPQKALWVSCVDVDRLAAMMAYIQLSLLHIPAEVIVGNTLSMQLSEVMGTPAHYLGFWDAKLRIRSSSAEVQPALEKEVVNISTSSEPVIHSQRQLSMFDVIA